MQFGIIFLFRDVKEGQVPKDMSQGESPIQPNGKVMRRRTPEQAGGGEGRGTQKNV